MISSCLQCLPEEWNLTTTSFTVHTYRELAILHSMVFKGLLVNAVANREVWILCDGLRLTTLKMKLLNLIQTLHHLGYLCQKYIGVL